MRVTALQGPEELEDRLTAGNLLSVTPLLIDSAYVAEKPAPAPVAPVAASFTLKGDTNAPHSDSEVQATDAKPTASDTNPTLISTALISEAFQAPDELMDVFPLSGPALGGGGGSAEAQPSTHSDAAAVKNTAPSSAGKTATPATSTKSSSTKALTLLASVAAAPAQPSLVFVDSAWASLPARTPMAGPGTQMGYDSFATVQAALNAVAPGGTVEVAPGTVYNEALSITKSATLADPGGTAALQPNSVITDPFGQHDILFIGNGATVTLDSIVISGPGPGMFDSIDYGIFVGQGATLNLSNSTVANISDNPLSGDQNGVGIGVGRNFDATAGSATLTNDTVFGYQKGGIVVDGPGSTADIENCAVTGVGPTPLIAQNGIQVSREAVATVSGNVISGNSYTGIFGGSDPLTATQSCGILLYQAGAGTTVTGNSVSANDIGIYSNSDGPVSLDNNDVEGNPDEGIFIDQSQTEASGNTVSGSNQGFTIASFGGNTADSVATVTSNEIIGNGTALALLNDTPSNVTQPQLTAHFNRIFGNAVGVDNETPGSADVTLNWWGSNAGPGSQSVSGADASTWLVLTLTVDPAQVHPGDSATVIAELDQDSTGVLHTEGYVPNGIPDTITAGTGGLSEADTSFTQGEATAIYTAPPTFGTDQESVTVDNQTVTSVVQVTNLIAVTQSYVVAENGVLHVNVANGLLANDSAADGGRLRLVTPGTYQTDHGVIHVRADGSFTYHPNQGYLGSDSFTYLIQEQGRPGISTMAVANFLVAANPPDKMGEITGLEAPKGGGNPAVPGNSAYPLSVFLPANAPYAVTDVHWVVTSGGQVANFSDAAGQIIAKPFSLFIELTNTPTFRNNPREATIQVDYTYDGKKYVTAPLTVDVLKVTVTKVKAKPEDDFTAETPRQITLQKEGAAFIEFDPNKTAVKLVLPATTISSGDPLKGPPGLKWQSRVTITSAHGDSEDAKQITVGFVQHVRPVLFSLSFKNIGKALYKDVQNNLYYLDQSADATNAKVAWVNTGKNSPLGFLFGKDDLQVNIKEDDTPYSTIPLEFGNAKNIPMGWVGGKVSAIALQWDFQLDVAAQTTAAPGYYFPAARALQKGETSWNNISWSFNGSSDFNPAGVTWVTNGGVAKVSPPDHWQPLELAGGQVPVPEAVNVPVAGPRSVSE